jgi:cytochrome c biogenesis protein CcdA
LGILLLLLYSFGHGILAVIAGTSMGFVRKALKERTVSRR